MPERGIDLDVLELCRRVLGDHQRAAGVATALAQAPPAATRLQALADALAECRRVAAPDGAPARPTSPPPGDRTLAEAVDAELALANQALPAPDRALLALREAFGLDYAEIGAVSGLEAEAVPERLSLARLGLRAELRGPTAGLDDACPERSRALAGLARRLDDEAGPEGEAEWVADHLATCPACGRAHAAMLEASVCYRAWGRR